MSEKNPQNHTEEKTQSSMEDEIKARREARRRKILENAQNRLQKLNINLSGKEPNGEVIMKDIYPDPEMEKEQDVNNLPLGGGLSSSSSSTSTIASQKVSSLEDDHASGYRAKNFSNFSTTAEPENLFRMWYEQKENFSTNFDELLKDDNANDDPFKVPQNDNKPRSTGFLDKNPLVKTFLQRKLHLVIISLLTYLIFEMEMEYVICYSVFFPLLIWELIEAIVFRSLNSQNSSILFLIFFMMGVKSSYITPLTKILGKISKILKDVGTFMFFFVLCYVIKLNFFQAAESQPEKISHFGDL